MAKLEEKNPLKSAWRVVVVGARVALGAVALFLIIWSLYWVALRDLALEDDLEGKTQLTILHWGDRAEDQIVESLAASFERENPDIVIERINATAGYTSKLQTMIAGGNPPDLFFFNSHMLPEYADKGIIRPIEDFLAEDIENNRLPFDFDDLFQQTVDSFRFDGNVTGRGELYALPTTFTPHGFFYNKTLFDEAGVEYPTDDWTWDEFEEKARAIGRLEGVYGCAFETGTVPVRLYLRSYGLDFFSDGFDEVHLTDPAVVERLGVLHDWRFGENSGQMLTPGASTVESASSSFIQGNIGMTGPTGRWVVPGYREIDDFEWDFAQIPKGTEQTNLMYVAAWCIAADSEHPREAWRVARHFAKPELQAISSRYGLVMPTHRGVAEGPEFVNPAIKPDRDDLFIDAADHAVAVQYPAEPAFNTALQKSLDETLRMNVVSVKEAMRRAEREWNRVKASPLRGEDFPEMPWMRIVSSLTTVLGLAGVVGLFFWWRRRPQGGAFSEELAGMTMIAPWVIGFLVFIAGPMALSFLLAFSKWSGVATLDHAQWVGFANWKAMFQDERMLRALWVTVYYVLLMVPLGQISAILVAMLMAREARGINVYRSIWYLPTVLAGVGMAVMWMWVFDAEHGLLNKMLAPVFDAFNAVVLTPLASLFGAEKPPNLRPPEWFLGDAKWFGVPAFVIASLWNVGGPMLIYLAGLHSIPKTLYESARIDGAGSWAQFRHITLPMLSPVILFNFIMAIIGSFQVFTQAFVMTRGGPADATLFYVLYLYTKAFENYEMGYASAMAWFLFVIVLILTLFTLRASKKRVHYEGERA